CRQFAAVGDRPEGLRCVNEEVGEGHQAGEEEGDWAREQADQEEKAAEQFQNSGGAGQAEKVERITLIHGETEQFLTSMLHEKECADDAQDAQNARLPDV